MTTRIRYRNFDDRLVANVQNFTVTIELETFFWSVSNDKGDYEGQSNSVNAAKKAVKEQLVALGIEFTPESRKSKKQLRMIKEAQKSRELELIKEVQEEAAEGHF
jgi:hypothetical protein